MKGKESPDGSYKEAEFTLDTATMLAEVLEKKYGIEAVLVDYEHENSSTELNEVVSRINKEKGDICVSIHSNAVSGGWSSANGMLLLTYKNEGESLRLAEKIREACHPALPLNDQGIRDGSQFAMIRDTSMPCVLVETAFHTNKEDLELLKSKSFRRDFAEAVAIGIAKYFGVAPLTKRLYTVQLGVFQSEENALALVDKARQAGFEAVIKEV